MTPKINFRTIECRGEGVKGRLFEAFIKLVFVDLLCGGVSEGSIVGSF